MEEVIKQIALQTGKDIRVIKLIAEHPLLFTRHRMEDGDDMRAIMIKYLGKFVFKFKATAEDKKRVTDRYLKRKSIAVIK